MDQYIGEIRLVGFNFAPQNWAFCQGQLLSISQNTALFSLLGTYYGGNGVNTFGLPDLRSRVAIGMGQGQGLSIYNIGQMGGTENATLLGNNLPAHAHSFALQANSGAADQSNPTNAIFAVPQDNNGSATVAYTQQKGNAVMATQNTNPAGSSLPFPIIQPYLGLNYIIALQGIYPTRS